MLCLVVVLLLIAWDTCVVLSILFMIASLAQWQVYDCPSENAVRLIGVKSTVTKNKTKHSKAQIVYIIPRGGGGDHKLYISDVISSKCRVSLLIMWRLRYKLAGVDLFFYREMYTLVLKILNWVSFCGPKAHSCHLHDSQNVVTFQLKHLQDMENVKSICLVVKTSVSFSVCTWIVCIYV